jgi:DUF971 family protein
MSIATTPRRITISIEEQTFTIHWADGLESIYPLDGLRRACPCVHCQGGHANMGAPPDPMVMERPPQQRWERPQVERAGSVGLRITWDDGHNTGIYTWERLRALSPQ